MAGTTNLLVFGDVAALAKEPITEADGATVDLLITEIEAAMKAAILDWTEEDGGTYQFDGHDSSFLYLGRWLRTPTSVTVDGSVVSPANLVNKGHVLVLKTGVWPDGTANIEIEGDWGFVLEPPLEVGLPEFIPDPYPSAPADPISEFKLLARIMARQLLPDYFQPEATSEGVGGQSFSYLDQARTAISQSRLALALVDKYRGIGIA